MTIVLNVSKNHYVNWEEVLRETKAIVPISLPVLKLKFFEVIKIILSNER